MDQRVTGKGAYGAGTDRKAGGQPPTPWQVLLMATRPKTLILSSIPVLTASFWAWQAKAVFRLDVLVLALLGAMAIQIGTNLWNDAVDGARGDDDGQRLGPPRVTALGLAPAASVKLWAGAAFGFAAVCGAILAMISGWPIIVIGILSVSAGLAYSAGPRPIAFTPFGELFVLAFFGIAAVAGTYYLHVGSVSTRVVELGLVIGLPAAAVLLVNNHRDRDVDTIAGRRTLAIIIGDDATRVVYGALLFLAIAGAIGIVRPACLAGWFGFLPVLGLAIALVNGFRKSPVSPALNAYLARTGLFQLVLAVTIAVGTSICG
ncbi:MAG: 1,4-dihydroxy-2-naphthoate octaprenyltransferase [Hyphomicrobiales bacterium]|nr:1,4-dihydroxy-2-naphthoate octaprenyltransferase [Hyphomicrobiales bacterium]